MKTQIPKPLATRVDRIMSRDPHAPPPRSDLYLAELECYARLFSNIRQQKPDRFILLGHYRTGSTLLQSLLDSHPEITCDAELLRPFQHHFTHRLLSTYRFVDGRSRIAPKKAQVYGIDLKIAQLLKLFRRRPWLEPIRFIPKCQEKGWKIIYLNRSNTLRQAISTIIGNKRREHVLTIERPEPPACTIEPQTLINQIKWIEKVVKLERQSLTNVPHITVNYETDLLDAANHQKTMDRIFDYLQLPHSSVSTKLLKMAPNKLGDNIANFDEIVQEISGTKYESLLSQP